MRLSIGSDAFKNNNTLNTLSIQRTLFDKPFDAMDDDIQQKDQTNILKGYPYNAFTWGIRKAYL